MFRGNFDCAGEQNYSSRLGVGLLRSYQSVPPNLAASLGARKRSDVMTVSKKERRYSYLCQHPSEIRPLAVCWVWMLLETGAREANLHLYSLIPLT